MSDQQERLRWIYLTDWRTKTPQGMRCWMPGFRCDIYPADDQFLYYVSRTEGGGSDWLVGGIYYADDVFEAMRLGERLLREIASYEQYLMWEDEQWNHG